MNDDHTSQRPKRPRGRPKGTAAYEQKDLRLLTVFADQATMTPGTKLAPFLARHGYAQHDIRRAQQRWRSKKGDLLRQAKLRAEATPGKDLLGILSYWGKVISALGEAARPFIDRLAGSLEWSQRAVEARKELGLPQWIPLDPTDAPAVEAAFARYEASIGAGLRPTDFDKKTFDELSWAHKFYCYALLFHELSLKAASSETEEDAAVSSDKVKARGGKS